MESFDNIIKKLKKYIFENIDKIKNHKNYLDIVEFTIVHILKTQMVFFLI